MTRNASSAQCLLACSLFCVLFETLRFNDRCGLHWSPQHMAQSALGCERNQTGVAAADSTIAVGGVCGGCRRCGASLKSTEASNQHPLSSLLVAGRRRMPRASRSQATGIVRLYARHVRDESKTGVTSWPPLSQAHRAQPRAHPKASREALEQNHCRCSSERLG
jgi:hypothetical protein